MNDNFILARRAAARAGSRAARAGAGGRRWSSAAGVTGCSCALRSPSAGCRVRVHEAREVAGGASGRNGGFALRGGAMRYDARAREAWARARADALGSSPSGRSTAMAALAGDELRRVGQPPPRRRRGRARRARAPSSRRFARTASRPSGSTRSPAPLDRLFAARSSIRRDGAMHPARWVRRLAAKPLEAGAEIVEGTPRPGRRARRRRGRRRHRRAHARACCRSSSRARRARCAGRCSPPRRSGAPVRPAALRAPRLRLLAAAPGRPSGRRRQARRELRDREHRRRRDDAGRPGAHRGARRRAARRGCRAVTHRWAGIWGETPDKLPLAGSGPGPRRRVGRRRLLGARERARASPAATSSRARSRGEHPPELALFDPPGSLVARRVEQPPLERPDAAAPIDAWLGAQQRQVQPVRARHASAMARSWIASPVESKIVISSSPRASRRVARQHRAELRHVARADRARLDRVRELAAVARLLPVVAEDARPRQLRRARSRPCPARRRPSGSRAGPAGAIPRGARSSCPGVTVTTHVRRERLGLRRRDPSSRARARGLRAPAPDRRPRAQRRARARRTSAPPRGRSRLRRSPPPSQRPGRAERLGREHGGRARAQRGHRARVEHRLEPPVVGVREQHDARSPSAGRAPGCPGTTSPTSAARGPPPSAGIARKSPAG